MPKNFSEEVFLMVAVATFLIIFLVMIVFFAVVTNQKRKFLYTKRMEDMQNSFTRELLSSKVEIREETLKSVASELHDNVGHMVTLGLMHLNLMPAISNQDEETQVQEARHQLNRALDSLRDISKTMNADILLQGGLTQAIDRQLNRLRKSSFYEVEFKTEGDEPVFKNEQHALIIFRIVQESITNIIRHSQAKKISILVKNDHDQLQVRTTDNGTGFPVKQTLTANDKGMGLRNMLTRAKLVGAAFDIESTEAGTTSTLIYPLK
jgi:signal transduction histidine kinase